MPAVPKKIEERLKLGIKKYQPILLNAKSRDVGEADTVTIIKDLLSEVFGYDKYSEITSEFSIRGTFCDLAIKLDNKLSNLIEVKAVGIELKDQHVKQAIDYSANEGIDWVVLTNGLKWQVYKLTFSKPIEKELVVSFAIDEFNIRSTQDIESLCLLCKEGWQRSALGEYHIQKQALSRFFIGALILSESVLDVIRRELKKVTPDVKITNDEIKSVLVNEVIKREVIEGERADNALKKISKVTKKSKQNKIIHTPNTKTASDQPTNLPTNDNNNNS